MYIYLKAVILDLVINGINNRAQARSGLVLLVTVNAKSPS